MSRLIPVLALAWFAPWTGITASETMTLQLTVTDIENRPVEEARITVYDWTGQWRRVEVEGSEVFAVSDAEGRAQLKGLPKDRYLAARIESELFAPAMYEFEPAGSGSQEVAVVLSPPVRTTLRIFSSDGSPIAGAELLRLECVDVNGNTTYLTQKIADSLGIPLLPSDESGSLPLPTLPRDARLKVSVIHPRFRAAQAEMLKAVEGEIARLELQTGVPVELKFVPTPGVPDVVDGADAEVNFYAPASGTRDPVSIRHRYRIEQNMIRFTAYPRQYEQLSVKMEDYFVTPDLIHTPASPMRQLDLSSSTPRTITMNVRPKVKVRGRVVTRDGQPVSDVDLWGSISSLSPQWKAPLRTPESDQQRLADLRYRWAPGGNATTDQEGRYEIDLSPGAAQIEPYRPGYFARPHVVEFAVEPTGPSEAPVITLFPVPTLRGIVTDSEGNPQPDMVVRMRSVGFGDADPIGRTGDDGSFELKMSRIPYRRSFGGLVASVFVVAFDPRSELAGIAEVDVADVDATDSIRVVVAATDPHWVVDPLADRLPEEDDAVIAGRRERLEKLRATLPKGLKGQTVPDLSPGTWLNCDARSLSEFHGKWVLLDFWFIGCGPCERDLPSIKLAHEMFDPDRFAVVSVHRQGQSPESVRVHAEAKGMDYPIVVDDEAGTITDQYRKLGVTGYPSYILVDPAGRVFHNDNVMSPPSLRKNKLELIYERLRGG